MSDKKKKNTAKTFVIIFLYIFLQVFAYFNYDFLTTGWHNELAKLIILILTPVSIILLFLSDKLKIELLYKLILWYNWIITALALIFAVFIPFVMSQDYFDLFLTQAVYVLNPGIAFSFLFFITSSLILIRHLKKLEIKSILLLLLPILIWLLLRIAYEFINSPVFHA
jgi:hypothetical protein